MDFVIENAIKNSEQMPDAQVGKANIKVIGVGGAGSNMISWLYNKGVKGAEILACNTDLQHLGMTCADKKFLMGKEVTNGLGCGGYPAKGAGGNRYLRVRRRRDFCAHPGEHQRYRCIRDSTHLLRCE